VFTFTQEPCRQAGDFGAMDAIAEATAELWRYTLERPVGGSGVGAVDVLIVSLTDAAGRTGFGFSYVLGGRDALPLDAARGMLERFVTGRPAAHPEARWREIAASFNRTGAGPYGTALAAIDVAGWDLYAKTLGLSLGVAMGGAPRRVPVYGSGGFYAGQDPDEAADVAAVYARSGVRAVKPRAAGDAGDAPLLRRVAGAAGVALMVDANEKCTPVSAARLVRAAADAGALFVEEPLPAYDLAGYRMLARSAGIPLATGEHLRTAAEALPFLAEGLCAVMQPDLQALGGLTPCLRVARIAEAHNVEIAPHFLPGLFAHLAAAAPNVTWLEDFPLLEPLFTGWPERAADGTMAPRDVPGHGLAPADGAREAYRI
jgi:L-alanine-DL-glutamate epimerase-like enolase superfamily enzyme